MLRLSPVTPEDEGVYSCTAENPVGLVAANISLSVTCECSSWDLVFICPELRRKYYGEVSGVYFFFGSI